jgi:hypothetical protein
MIYIVTAPILLFHIPRAYEIKKLIAITKFLRFGKRSIWRAHVAVIDYKLQFLQEGSIT